MCGWQLDVSQYFLCLVAVQVSLRVFLVDVHNNFRICARELEKYDGEAGSEDVVVTCKVVLLTNINKNSIIKFAKNRAFKWKIPFKNLLSNQQNIT